MKNLKPLQTIINTIESVTCDICKKTYSDEMELQEFHYVDFIGGYLSTFGDGNKINCDICQHCLKKLIGQYVRLDNEM